MEEVENTTQYFAEREEQAVIDYINSDSLEEKNKIYNEILIEPFRKMIQSILRRYPIHIGNYDMEEVEQNALTHLVEHMVKFNPNKITKSGNKTKAFSYCQTIIRNYYKDHSKKSYTEKKINLSFDDYIDEINENIEYTYEMETENQHQLEKLINAVIEKIEDHIDNDPTIKKNEILVGDAIVNVLKNWQVLFMEDSPDGRYEKRITNKFAKNKILLYLKEQTGLSTKEIRIGIKPFKEIYFIEKIDYIDD
jgi:DNA-directed RNA polymerase specialized sigma24 family protein